MPAPVDIDTCTRTFLARMVEREQALKTLSASLRAQASEAARVLSTEFGVRRTWLFGSLAWGEPHEASDVDLLVEGLENRLATPAEIRAAELISSPLDLVRIEDAPAGLVERVRREGLLLHESS